MDKPAQKESSDQFIRRVNDEMRKPTYDKLRIEFSKHALAGLLAKDGLLLAPAEAATRAFEYANAMVRQAKNYDDFYAQNGMGGE